MPSRRPLAVTTWTSPACSLWMSMRWSCEVSRRSVARMERSDIRDANRISLRSMRATGLLDRIHQDVRSAGMIERRRRECKHLLALLAGKHRRDKPVELLLRLRGVERPAYVARHVLDLVLVRLPGPRRDAHMRG